MELQSVFCEIRTEFLNIIYISFMIQRAVIGYQIYQMVYSYRNEAEVKETTVSHTCHEAQQVYITELFTQ
jgi:hypothetical protein